MRYVTNPAVQTSQMQTIIKYLKVHTGKQAHVVNKTAVCISYISNKLLCAYLLTTGMSIHVAIVTWRWTALDS